MDAGVNEFQPRNDAAEELVLRVSWNSQSPCELLTQAGQWIATNQDDVRGALSYYAAALTVDPSYGLAAWEAGQLLMGKGDFEQAREWFLKSSLAAPDHAPTFYKLSLCSFEIEDYSATIEYANKCLDLNPQHEGAFAAKIRSLHKSCGWRAIVTLIEAKTFPETQELLLYYCIALVKTGQYLEAAAFEKRIDAKTVKKFPSLSREMGILIREN